MDILAGQLALIMRLRTFCADNDLRIYAEGSRVHVADGVRGKYILSVEDITSKGVTNLETD